MTGEHYMAHKRPEQAQATYIRQVGYVKFTAKNKTVTASTNMSNIVYCAAFRMTTPKAAAASGYAKGSILWTSGKVSAGSVTFRRLTAGTQSGPSFWYELVGYP